MPPKPGTSRPKRGAAKAATISIIDALKNAALKKKQKAQVEVSYQDLSTDDELEFEDEVDDADDDDDVDEDIVMQDDDDDQEEIIAVTKVTTTSTKKKTKTAAAPTKKKETKSKITRKEGETRGRKPGSTDAKRVPKPIIELGPQEHTEAFYTALEEEFFEQVPPSTKDPWLTGYRSVDNRFLHVRGLNENTIKQVELITSLADVNEHHFNDSIELSDKIFDFPPLPSNLTIPKFKEQKISKAQLSKKLALDRDIRFWINDDDSEPLLKSQNIISFPKNDNYRKGSVMNTGGLPLCSSWMPVDLGETRHNYLFVSVIKHPNSTVIPQLSFADFVSFESALQIFKVLENGSVTLVRTLSFDCGAISSMKWSPSHGVSGLLGCLFSDGSLKFFNFNEEIINNGMQCSSVTTPSIEFKIPGSDLKFVSFDWTSERTVAAGLTLGFLAEFDIYSPEDPLYVTNVATSNIVSLVSTFSDYILSGKPSSRKVVLISTGDSSSYILDLKLLRLATVVAHRSRIPCHDYSYTPFVGCFMVVDESFSPKIFYPRDPFANSIIPSAEQVITTSMATSIYSNLSLVAFADGKLKLMNLTRKELAVKLSPAEPGSIVIYQLERSDAQDAYRLNMGYHVVDSAKDGKFVVKMFNTGVTATSISFNQRRGYSSWYAATYGCGTVIVEKLQSATVIPS